MKINNIKLFVQLKLHLVNEMILSLIINGVIFINLDREITFKFCK